MSSPRILVADDDPASRELIRYFLGSKGYNVAVADDGNRALDMGASGDFDLVILDVHMPLYDGTEVLQMLRKRFLNHPIKIIAVTADVSLDLRETLERAGADGYMTKPVDLAALEVEVTRLLPLQG
ncbi:MAG: response regulator [Candidatus Dormibacteraceae bacterium]